MNNEPRFQHRILSSGEHCVTSPDIKGLCAVAGNEADARREAIALAALFRELGVPLKEQTASTRQILA